MKGEGLHDQKLDVGNAWETRLWFLNSHMHVVTVLHIYVYLVDQFLGLIQSLCKNIMSKFKSASNNV